MYREKDVDVEGQCPDVEGIQAPSAGWLSEIYHALENSEEIGGASTRKVPISLRSPIQAPPAGWLCQLYHALENSEEFGAVSIPKVPDSYRSPAADFTPVEWWFGLHNREGFHTGGSQSLKIWAASAFGLKGALDWDEFCDDVVDDPAKLLKTYGVHSLDDVLTHISERELKCLLTLDALFLVLLLDWISQRCFTNSSAMCSFFKSSFLNLLGLINKDIFLIENQIPMALLRKVIKRCFLRMGDHQVTVDQVEESLDMILKAAMVTVRYLFPLRPELDMNGEVFIESYPLGRLGQCEHILECIYVVICGPAGVSDEGSDDVNNIAVESATTLEAAGIKIKSYQGTLDRTCFKNGVLHLPSLSMNDATVPLFRNLAMFEMAFGNHLHCPLRQHLQLMLELIATPADVTLLVNCKVIDNLLTAKACEHWQTLHEGIVGIQSRRFYNLKSDIDKHCRSKNKLFRAEFIHLFCSKPWLVLQVITVTFVTLATGMQAYTAVIGSNRMSPHFPH